MSINTLAKNLAARMTKSKLTLDRNLNEVSGWALVWDTAIVLPRLEMDQTSINQTDQQLTIKGTGNVFGKPETDITWFFEEDTQGTSVSLDVLFNASIGFSIGDGKWVVDDFGFSIFPPDSGKPLSGAVRCTLNAGSLRFPLSASIPTDLHGGIIRGAFDKVVLPDPDKFLTLLGQSDLLATLPAKITSLDAALYISDLMFKCNANQKTVDQICLTLGSDRDWPIIPNSLALQDPSLLFSIINPFDTTERVTSILVNATICVGSTSRLPIQLSKLGGTDWTIRLRAEHFPLPSISDLNALVRDQKLIALVPAEITKFKGIVLTAFDLRFDATRKVISALTLGFRLEDSWALPALGGWSLQNPSLNLFRSEGPNAKSVVSGSIEGTLTLCDTPVFISANMTEHLTFTGKVSKVNLSQVMKEFLDTVSLPSSLPDVAFSNVDLSLTPSTGEFSFSGQSSAEHWTIPLGIGQLTITDFGLHVARTVSGTSANQADTTCSISGQGTLDLAIGNCSATLSGTVTFEASGQRVGFTFHATGPNGNQLTLSFPSVAQNVDPQVLWEFDQLVIDHTENGWLVAAAASTSFTGLPSFLTTPIPGTQLSLVPTEPRTWKLTAETGSVVFSIDRLWDQPFPPTALPMLTVNQKTISLGVFWLDVHDWTIGFGDGSAGEPNMALQATIQVAVSDEINRVFGVGADGHPWLQLFKTFNQREETPLSAATSIQISLSEKGITAQLQGSPFNAIQPDQNGLYHILLGPNGKFGEFSCLLPEFSYNGLGWTAAGAFHIEKPLQLPLTPLKAALTQADLDPVAAVIPDAVPLDDFALIDQNNRLTFDPWLDKLRQGTPSLQISPDLMEALNRVASVGDEVLNRTPGQLNSYLNFTMPRDLSFAIEIGGTGGVKLDVSTRTASDPSSQPLKLLLPFAGPPYFLPELLGIQLTSLSLGEILSGSLFVLQLEGKFDRFDLLALVGCLSTGYLIDGKTTCKSFEHSYTVDQLLAVIPSGAFVPVPLFYKELAISYYGWEMLKYESRWSFPQPEGGLLALIGLCSQLRPFFADSTYNLDPNVSPKGFKLPFTIGPNYLQLPPYLGGALLGTTTGLPQWSVWKSLANMLNGLKTGDPQDFVSALPVEARVGDVDVTFGPFSLEVGFAVTTPSEFKAAIMPGKIRTEGGKAFARRLRTMGAGPDKQIAALLPKPGKGQLPPNGLIILLIGDVAVKNVVTLNSTFGLAAIASRSSGTGFGTGVQFVGTIGRAFTIAIRGAVTVTDTQISISGDTGIWWKTQRMTGLNLVTVVDKTGFFTQLTFTFTPKCSLTGGWTISTTEMAIQGNISWDYCENGPFTAKGQIVFSSEGLTLTTTQVTGSVLYGIAIQKLSATLPAAGGPLHATIDLTIPPVLNTALRGEIEVASTQAQQGLTNAQQIAVSALNALNGYELSVHGVKAMLVAMCSTMMDVISKRINALPKSKTFGRKPFAKSIPLRTEGAKEMAPYLRALQKFRVSFNRSTKQSLEEDIKKLADWALENKTHIVSRSFPVVGKINLATITVIDKATGRQLNSVRQNVHAWVAGLPETDIGLTLNGNMIQYAKGTVNAALNEIGTSLQSDMGNVPSVTGISVNTDLSALPFSGVSVIIRVSRGTKSKSYPATFDFTNPTAGAVDLLKIISKDLGTSL